MNPQREGLIFCSRNRRRSQPFLSLHQPPAWALGERHQPGWTGSYIKARWNIRTSNLRGWEGPQPGQAGRFRTTGSAPATLQPHVSPSSPIITPKSRLEVCKIKITCNHTHTRAHPHACSVSQLEYPSFPRLLSWCLLILQDPERYLLGKLLLTLLEQLETLTGPPIHGSPYTLSHAA